MLDEELLYIEDDKGRKLFYRFTPAAFISNFMPLLVVLHDQGETEVAPHFEYKMWNVLRPLDDFGYENDGSFWLGEKGDFFVKDLLQKLISKIAEEYECEEHIYLYGRGMGGYGAILHGILCKANAVYAYSPQIRLQDAKDTGTTQHLSYESVFAENLCKERDLSNFLNPVDTFPIFYLCKDGNAHQNGDESIFEEETAGFVDGCKQHAIACYLDRCISTEGDEDEALKRVLDMLERIVP